MCGQGCFPSSSERLACPGLGVYSPIFSGHTHYQARSSLLYEQWQLIWKAPARPSVSTGPEYSSDSALAPLAVAAQGLGLFFTADLFVKLFVKSKMPERPLWASLRISHTWTKVMLDFAGLGRQLRKCSQVNAKHRQGFAKGPWNSEPDVL